MPKKHILDIPGTTPEEITIIIDRMIKKQIEDFEKREHDSVTKEKKVSDGSKRQRK